MTANASIGENSSEIGRPVGVDEFFDAYAGVLRQDGAWAYRVAWPSIVAQVLAYLAPRWAGLPSLAGRHRSLVLSAAIWGFVTCVGIVADGAISFGCVRRTSPRDSYRFVATRLVRLLLASGVCAVVGFAGLGCCVVPGIAVSVVASTVATVVCVEGRRPIDAIGRSAALARSGWRPLALVYTSYFASYALAWAAGSAIRYVVPAPYTEAVVDLGTTLFLASVILVSPLLSLVGPTYYRLVLSAIPVDTPGLTDVFR